MKKLLIAIVLTLLLSVPAEAQDGWTKATQIGTGTFVAARILDTSLTSWLLATDPVTFREGNDFLSRPASNPVLLPAITGATTVGISVLALKTSKSPSKRTRILSAIGMGALAAWTIRTDINNYKLYRDYTRK